MSQEKVTQYLRPDHFDVEPAAPDADLKWAHWKYTFENFIAQLGSPDKSPDESLKLKVLVNHISPTIFNNIRSCNKYSDAISKLNDAYEKKQNITLARHRLTTRKQQPGENIAEYSRALNILAHECNFEAVTAEEHQDQAIRGTFISGILSSKIKERLLEKSLTLEETLNLAITLETAENTSQLLVQSLSFNPNPVNAATEAETRTQPNLATTLRRRCFFCGGNIHQRLKCPARNAECQLCSKRGHFAKVCRSSNRDSNNNSTNAAVTDDDTQVQSAGSQLSAFSAAAPSSLSKATTPITLNNYRADALVDTGSSIQLH